MSQDHRQSEETNAPRCLPHKHGEYLLKTYFLFLHAGTSSGFTCLDRAHVCVAALEADGPAFERPQVDQHQGSIAMEAGH